MNKLFYGGLMAGLLQVLVPVSAAVLQHEDQRLSLNFQDIEVRAVLQVLADFQGVNLLVSDDVAGRVTLRLEDVPWSRALDLVLHSKGLDKRLVDNVLLIAPAQEMAERDRQRLMSQQQRIDLEPQRTGVIQLNHARAADIAELFRGLLQSRHEASVPVSSDSIRVDERSNSIVAHLSESRLSELRALIERLDVPIRQVMIEARIVEVNVDYDKALGVRWGGGGSTGAWQLQGASGTAVEGTTDAGPFVDLGVSTRTSGIGIGYLGSSLMLDLQLSAMEKSGNGEIVSQPKVMTADGETARILKGQEVPYQEASSSGATSTSFKQAALSLEVTPKITADRRITMDVKVTKDAPDFSNALDGVPPIHKNEVNARVQVVDGETLVIGGVFSTIRSQGEESVPVLGRIPGLGRLFRREIVQDRKAELLVFLTPRIMQEHNNH